MRIPSVSRTPANRLSARRIDAEYYGKEHLKDEEILEAYGSTPLGKFGKLFAGPFGSKVPNSKFVDKGVPLFRVGNIGWMEIVEENLAQIPESLHQEIEASEVLPGDLLIVKASVGEKIAVLPDHFKKANITQHIIGLRPREGADTCFLAAFLMAQYGRRQLERRSLGAIIQYLGVVDARTVLVPKADPKAQKYIGNKVRQAEKLRSQAQKLHQERLSLLAQKIEWADKAFISRMSFRAPSERLTDRLDAKYYDPSVESIRLESQKNHSIDTLKKSIRNGFECREFVEEGIPYITVSEVVSGRLEVDKAPQIGNSVEIPDKACIDSKTVLAVRTGNIGTVVQPLEEDSHAVISSHLIRLKFESEEIAAVVTAYLNSIFGQKLQKAAIYGSVQPEISQDELLKIRIPKNLFQHGDKLWSLYQASEYFYRYSKRLIKTAQYLVEGLIEPDINLTEKDLIKAYENLDVDRALMERLRVDGLDGEGDPLFPDLDILYDLINKASESEPAEA